MTQDLPTPPRPRIRLWVDAPLERDMILALDKDQSHYLVTVMRAKSGEQLGVFNGRDGEWWADLARADRKHAELHLIELRRAQTPEPDCWLLFAPIKKARLDFVAQKATEMGVSKLQPVMTRRTIVDRVKDERLAANAREAAEQCDRLTVPEIGEAISLTALLADWPEDRRLLFLDEDLTALPVLTALESLDPGPWAVLIGPEGGFDDAERAAIRRLPQCTPATLGPRLLRADTAAIAALALWQAALGDWR